MKILNYRGVDVHIGHSRADGAQGEYVQFKDGGCYIPVSGGAPVRDMISAQGDFYIFVSGGLAVRDKDKAWVRIYKNDPTQDYFEGYIDALIEMGNV